MLLPLRRLRASGAFGRTSLALTRPPSQPLMCLSCPPAELRRQSDSLPEMFDFEVGPWPARLEQLPSPEG